MSLAIGNFMVYEGRLTDMSKIVQWDEYYDGIVNVTWYRNSLRKGVAGGVVNLETMDYWTTWNIESKLIPNA